MTFCDRLDTNAAAALDPAVNMKFFISLALAALSLTTTSAFHSTMPGQHQRTLVKSFGYVPAGMN